MKKFLMISLLIFAAFFFISCGGSKKDKDKTDTGDTDTDVTDTADSSDTDPASDTEPGGNTEPTDDADTADDSDNTDSTDDSDTAAERECETLEFGEVYYMNSSSGDYYEAYAENGMAGDKAYSDVLDIDFRNKKELETGTFTLSDSRKTCEYCIFLGEDFKTNETTPTKKYFQESGELVFEEVQEGTLRSRGHGSFRLVEIDSKYEPVDGGKCYDVKNLEWDTICRPDCDGKICGDDGCGGTCGDGCGELACNAAQTECVPYDCETLDMNIVSLNYYMNYGIPTYQTMYSASTGADYNIFYMEIVDTANAVGEHILDENSVSGAAGVTLSLWEIEDINDADSTVFYFPKKGTLTIYEYDKESTYISFSTEDVMVEEVTMYRDDNGVRYTIPVAGGKCYDLVDFEYHDRGY